MCQQVKQLRGQILLSSSVNDSLALSVFLENSPFHEWEQAEPLPTPALCYGDTQKHRALWKSDVANER